MEDLNAIIDGLTTTGIDASGLHGVLSVMQCAFSGDEPTEKTMAAAFYWLCSQVERLEQSIDEACIDLNRMKKELEERGKEQ